ncbi:hypothetical protein, partial [Victivallis vadensis]|uniref:hypothetical protein n=1 Tax=Victivallis vadensis TaxID=172901 RepID=UPI003D089D38
MVGGNTDKAPPALILQGRFIVQQRHAVGKRNFILRNNRRYHPKSFFFGIYRDKQPVARTDSEMERPVKIWSLFGKAS